MGRPRPPLLLHRLPIGLAMLFLTIVAWIILILALLFLVGGLAALLFS